MASRGSQGARRCHVRCGPVIGLGFALGACDPLIATVGVEGSETASPEDASTPFVAGGDAQPEAMRDAARESEIDALPSMEAAEGGPAAGDAGSNFKGCIVLPELIDLSTNSMGATRAVDNGVVWARFDKELGCANPSNVITYGRVDGTLLVPKADTYVLAWPGTSGQGAVTAIASSVECGDLVPWLFFGAVILPGVPDCHRSVPQTRYIRLMINSPSPLPQGLLLCEGGCPW